MTRIANDIVDILLEADECGYYHKTESLEGDLTKKVVDSDAWARAVLAYDDTISSNMKDVRRSKLKNPWYAALLAIDSAYGNHSGKRIAGAIWTFTTYGPRAWPAVRSQLLNRFPPEHVEALKKLWDRKITESLEQDLTSKVTQEPWIKAVQAWDNAATTGYGDNPWLAVLAALGYPPDSEAAQSVGEYLKSRMDETRSEGYSLRAGWSEAKGHITFELGLHRPVTPQVIHAIEKIWFRQLSESLEQDLTSKVTQEPWIKAYHAWDACVTAGYGENPWLPVLVTLGYPGEWRETRSVADYLLSKMEELSDTGETAAEGWNAAKEVVQHELGGPMLIQPQVMNAIEKVWFRQMGTNESLEQELTHKVTQEPWARALTAYNASLAENPHGNPWYAALCVFAGPGDDAYELSQMIYQEEKHMNPETGFMAADLWPQLEQDLMNDVRGIPPEDIRDIKRVWFAVNESLEQDLVNVATSTDYYVNAKSIWDYMSGAIRPEHAWRKIFESWGYPAKADWVKDLVKYLGLMSAQLHGSSAEEIHSAWPYVKDVVEGYSTPAHVISPRHIDTIRRIWLDQFEDR